MIARTNHIEDDRLLDLYMADRTGEPRNPPLADHLADCAACGERLEALARFMDDLKADAIEETDAVFSSEHLRVQREHIARRVEQVGRVARIISFPGRLVARHVGGTRFGKAPRWTAAAAAAGLFIGVGLGMFVDQQRGARFELSERTARAAAVSAAAPSPAVNSEQRPPSADYDSFVLELDLARGGPRSPELRPLDVMTPHVYPTSLQVH